MASLVGGVAVGLVGLLFVVAGVAKLRAPRLLYFTILDLSLAGPGLSRLVARLVPLAEIALGSLLLLRWRPDLVVAASIALLVAFTVVIAVAIARKRDVKCSCFGVLSDGRLDRQAAARNAALLVLLLIGTAWHNGATGLGAQLAADGVAAAVLVCLVLPMSLRRIMATAPPAPVRGCDTEHTYERSLEAGVGA